MGNMEMNNPEIPIFIGIPELARILGQTRQSTHYLANRGAIPITAYPLRRGRQMTYVFLEKEAQAYQRKRAERLRLTASYDKP